MPENRSEAELLVAEVLRKAIDELGLPEDAGHPLAEGNAQTAIERALDLRGTAQKARTPPAR